MDNYANEIRADIAYYHGSAYAPSKAPDNFINEIKEAMAIYNAMSQKERDMILQLKRDNFIALQQLTKEVKERAGL